ncbi:DUF6766 family protein [Actinomadura madurae]|uniref:DUF6766 family protein n=1 Tax=Actinomadura madurae TaxID=1993 RepID=UPI00202610DE|nr:DUF6766 family protein [Actinomadura madurae]MCP9955701.1 hypothetical protein [Actinomadura madurae]MCP9972434.1 hypothetical protein [Actinomadura madurae]MCP9984946.1 hypothetical protein [Actinomadura madurae]MCQ0003496.1 hypothetical protein [Actinomadura madurae]MCQ0021141.1 hypothetical protein [Actinomadura madurae]
MRRYLRDNGLPLFFFLILVGALVGQAFAGLADYNNQQIAEGGHSIGMGRYLTSSQFGVDVMENWQSEYLQFFLYIFVTVWLTQRGSPESKNLDKRGTESDADQKVGKHAEPSSPALASAGGLRGLLFSRSLGLVMGTIFLLSLLVQSIAGRVAYNANQLAQYEDTLSWGQYIGSADFWSRTFQNWQSEFLAVASMAALSIYLRQRGSPESKPVGTSHGATGIEG